MTTTEIEQPYSGTRENLLGVLETALHRLDDTTGGEWDNLDPIAQLAYRDEAAQCMTALIGQGAVRPENDVKAEALREAADALRLEAADSKTKDGKYELEELADWLDTRRARLEGTVTR